jgi:hypothetical protein
MSVDGDVTIYISITKLPLIIKILFASIELQGGMGGGHTSEVSPPLAVLDPPSMTESPPSFQNKCQLNILRLSSIRGSL